MTSSDPNDDATNHQYDIHMQTGQGNAIGPNAHVSNYLYGTSQLQRELEDYFKEMDKVLPSLLRINFRGRRNETVVKTAQLLTMRVLDGLDKAQKGRLLLYLYRSGLIGEDNIIHLSGADLREADLREANLSGADLSGADLRRAMLSNARLSGADLNRANLSGANLSGANLSEADLEYTYLSGANLSGADLIRANLYHAHLREANLSRAILYHAHLAGADLTRATLRDANLSDAYLGGALLYGADLSGANRSGARFHQTIMPDGSEYYSGAYND